MYFLLFVSNLFVLLCVVCCVLCVVCWVLVGVSYFVCEPQHGLLVRPNEVEFDYSKPAPSASRRMSSRDRAEARMAAAATGGAPTGARPSTHVRSHARRCT